MAVQTEMDKENSSFLAQRNESPPGKVKHIFQENPAYAGFTPNRNSPMPIQFLCIAAVV